MNVDLGDQRQIDSAMTGASVAFYLVHSLNESNDFEQREYESATNFARSAARNNLSKIIYLGALAKESSNASPHMRSRHKVGEILRDSGIPTIEFRASVIIGAGSMPFESIRALVDRLPVMIIPRWVRQPLQPIAASDLRKFLLKANEPSVSRSQIVEVGGANAVSYLDLMRLYAKARGLRRMMINVPFVSPSLSSHWLRIFTPAHYQVGRRIVDSSMHDSVVVNNPSADFDIEPMAVSRAVDNALSEESNNLEFLDQVKVEESDGLNIFRSQFGTRFIEQRTISMDVSKRTAVAILKNTGGEHGWHWATWLWKLRGVLDRTVGGVGYRESSHETQLKPGNQLNFWTIQRVEYDRLTLSADMRLPGEAIFDLRVMDSNDDQNESSTLVHTVAFNPKGLAGYAYWFLLFPIHTLVFNRMIKSAASKL